MESNILKKSAAKVVELIFTMSAWSGFIDSPLIKGVIYYPRLDESANLINIGSTIASGAVCKRTLGASCGCIMSVAVCPVFALQSKVVQSCDFT